MPDCALGPCELLLSQRPAGGAHLLPSKTLFKQGGMGACCGPTETYYSFFFTHDTVLLKEQPPHPPHTHIHYFACVAANATMALLASSAPSLKSCSQLSCLK